MYMKLYVCILSVCFDCIRIYWNECVSDVVNFSGNNFFKFWKKYKDKKYMIKNLRKIKYSLGI